MMKKKLGLALIACSLAMASWAGVPGDSVYRWTTPVTDAQGQSLQLASLSGKPVLTTMFYGDCHTACPVAISRIKNLVGDLGATQEQLRVVLFSLEPGQDGPERLSHLMHTHGLQVPLWRLAVAKNEGDTRALAGLLGIKYKRVANGEIEHTTNLLLLDKDGRVLAKTDATNPEPIFLDKLRTVLRTTP